MKNVVAYSLWGDTPMYWIGSLRNIELVSKYLPGWICRFYIDKNCRQDLIDTIKGDNVEIILMDNEGYNYTNISERFNHSGLFWRFLPLLDDDVSILLSRDCDSRISKREINAINEWLSSDKDFHIMRDHPYHTVPILSGMWGCRNGILKNIDDLLKIWSEYRNKGVFHAEDQDFLGQIVYPIIRNNVMEHSEFNISYGNEIKSFPDIRENYEFVGNVFDENDIRNPEYWKIIEKMI